MKIGSKKSNFSADFSPENFLIPPKKLYLFDVWGVLYDGKKIINEGAHLLEKASRFGYICLLSNTSRTSAGLKNMLYGKGMDISLLDRIITSGEMARNYLFEFSKKSIKSDLFVYMLGGSSNLEWVADAENIFTDDIGKAKVLFSANLVSEEEKESICENLLKSIKRDIPLISSNNDIFVRIDGKLCLGSGYIAKLYAEMGGRVFSFGKPDLDFFRTAMEGYSVKDVMMFGDSLTTDIIPCKSLCVETAMLIGKGIHEIGIDEIEEYKIQILNEYKCVPDHFLFLSS